MVAVAIFIL